MCIRDRCYTNCWWLYFFMMFTSCLIVLQTTVWLENYTCRRKKGLNSELFSIRLEEHISKVTLSKHLKFVNYILWRLIEMEGNWNLENARFYFVLFLLWTVGVCKTNLYSLETYISVGLNVVKYKRYHLHILSSTIYFCLIVC